MRRPVKATLQAAQLANQAPAAKAAASKVEVEYQPDGRIKVDNWTTYRILANFTESKPELWSPESTSNLRLVHMAIGIVTELDELFPREEMLGVMQDNWTEEVGDLMWYIACMHTILLESGINAVKLEAGLDELLGLTPDGLVLSYNTRVMTLRGAQGLATDLLDATKKMLAYGNGSMNSVAALNIVGKAFDIARTCFIYALNAVPNPTSLIKILEANIDKLSKRYPEGFNTTDAINRQLAVEAEVFNKLARETSAEALSIPMGRGELDASV